MVVKSSLLIPQLTGTFVCGELKSLQFGEVTDMLRPPHHAYNIKKKGNFTIFSVCQKSPIRIFALGESYKGN